MTNFVLSRAFIIFYVLSKAFIYLTRCASFNERVGTSQSPGEIGIMAN